MKRYLRDPDGPTHLRRLVESARKDGLDDERRCRVADRLGLLFTVAGTSPGGSAAAASWSSMGSFIEALHARGGRANADRLALRLLRESPNTPWAARVRAALVHALRE